MDQRCGYSIFSRSPHRTWDWEYRGQGSVSYLSATCWHSLSRANVDPKKTVGLTSLLSHLLCRGKPPCVFVIVTVAEGVSYHNICLTVTFKIQDTILTLECHPSPPRIWHPFSAWVFVLHFFAVGKASSSQRLMWPDDLWQWLSGTFEAHPISGFRFSFLVIYGTFDEFSLSADMFHNCQNFDWSGI